MCGHVNRYETDTTCERCFAPVVCDASAVPAIKRNRIEWQELIQKAWANKLRFELKEYEVE
tara:strand:+ start:147 stop:329 length:183 start_codon:yes stop_codon:yes gene_type:complete